MDVMVQEAELYRLPSIRGCPQCEGGNGVESIEPSEQSGTEKTQHRHSQEVELREDIEEQAMYACWRRIRMTSLTTNAGSPMSLYDFYMYLKYIEHSSENLEFFIWYLSLPLSPPCPC
jgi:hypothetical protein